VGRGVEARTECDRNSVFPTLGKKTLRKEGRKCSESIWLPCAAGQGDWGKDRKWPGKPLRAQGHWEYGAKGNTAAMAGGPSGGVKREVGERGSAFYKRREEVKTWLNKFGGRGITGGGPLKPSGLNVKGGGGREIWEARTCYHRLGDGLSLKLINDQGFDKLYTI